MADNEVSFTVKLKDSFSEGINKVIKGFTGLDAATARSQVSTTALGVAFGQLGAKLVGKVLTGLKQFGAFLVSCVYEAANAQKYINALSASLQNVGITSNYVLEDLVRYSDELQNMSGISGDVYLEGMRLLTNFGLLGDELKRATASAYNLSLGLNVDLKSAFSMIARAAEGNMTMFGRYGITVDSTKSKSEQFAEALDKIDSKFGQLAGANADNLITKTGVLKEKWGEFKEDFGNAMGQAGGGIDILIWGTDVLKSTLKLLQNWYARVFEEVIIGAKNFELLFDAMSYGAQAAKTQLLRLGNTMKLVSDEAVDEAERELKSKAAEMEMTSQQIKLLKEQRTSVFDLSAAKKQASETEIAEGERQVAAAQANFAAQKKMQEEQEKAAKAAQKAEEGAAKEAQARQQRINDFKVSAEEQLLSKVAALRETNTRSDFAAADAQNRQEYESKINFLSMQIDAIREKEGNEVAAQSEKYEQLKILEEEYQAYLDESEAVQTERGMRLNALDEWLASSKYQAQANALNNISQLQNAKTKEMAVIGKTAAVTTATIDTYKAANSAYAAMAGIPIVGPALGAAAAAAAIAAGLMNVGKIVGVELAVGTPYVPEDMPATVHQGEIIVPRTFSEGLRSGDLVMSATDDIGRGGGDVVNSGNVNVNFNGDVLSDNPDNIARRLAEVLSRQIAGGQVAPFPTKERM